MNSLFPRSSLDSMRIVAAAGGDGALKTRTGESAHGKTHLLSFDVDDERRSDHRFSTDGGDDFMATNFPPAHRRLVREPLSANTPGAYASPR